MKSVHNSGLGIEMDYPRESRLSSWKEIADYLGYSERTCRRLEKENGLPVYRLEGGAGSRVFAYKPELDAWFHPKESRPTAVTPPTIERKLTIGKTAWGIAGVVVGLVVVLGAILLATSPKAQAANFHIDGSVLIITDGKDKELGRFDTGLPGLLDEKAYRDRFQVKTLDDENMVKWPTILIEDLDNDQAPEIIFSTQTQGEQKEGRLYCLDRRGRVLWEFQAGGRHVFGTEALSADFMIEGLGVFDLDRDGSRELYVIGAHVHEPPTQLAVLDHEGRLISEYWNYGRLIDLEAADIDSDGRPELLVVGTNNEYG
jgi:hypothetical protein